LDEESQGNSFEIEFLASGKNRDRDFVGFCGRKNELGVGRRLLERFQERIKRGQGQHVHFVDDVNPEPGGGRHVLDVFPELPDLLNASIGRSVDFLHVHGRSLGDFKA